MLQQSKPAFTEKQRDAFAAKMHHPMSGACKSFNFFEKIRDCSSGIGIYLFPNREN